MTGDEAGGKLQQGACRAGARCRNAGLLEGAIFPLVLERDDERGRGKKKDQSRTGRAADRPRNTDCLRRLSIFLDNGDVGSDAVMQLMCG